MDATSRKKAADPFSDADVVEHARPVIANLEIPRSRAVIDFLRTNRYGTFPDILGKVGGDARSLRRLVRVLKSRSNRYIRVTDQSRDDHVRTRRVVYELAPRGVEYLHTLGLEVPERPLVANYKHATLASHGTASIEVGIAGQENATLITWEQIAKSKNIPLSTANVPSPFDIPYPSADPNTGEIRFRHARADSPVFGIKLTHSTHNTFRFFPGIEADNATKSEKQLIDQFTAYLIIERDRISQSYFGFPDNSWYVPFLVRNAHQTDRVAWMMKILLNLSQGVGSKSIMFMPYQPDARPGYLFTEPWKRVGHQPIILSQ